MTKFSTMDKPERSFWHVHWTFKKILSCKECTICLSNYREYSPDIHHSTFPCTQWIRYIHRYRTGRSHNHYTAPETKTEIDLIYFQASKRQDWVIPIGESLQALTGPEPKHCKTLVSPPGYECSNPDLFQTFSRLALLKASYFPTG